MSKYREAVARHGSQAKAAAALGVSESTVRRGLNREGKNGSLSVDSQIVGLQQRLGELQSKYYFSLKEIEKLTAELSFQKAVDRRRDSIISESYPVKTRTKSEIVPCLNIGDWHSEEIVDSNMVGGANEYNPAVRDRRIRRFCQHAHTQLEMLSSANSFDTIVINILGDMISGHIHEELIQTNDQSPIEATLTVIEKLISTILFFHDNTDCNIDINCVCGNHARTTRKIQSKTYVRNSYEYLIYHMVARMLQDKKRLRFSIAEGRFLFRTIFDTKLRVHHGDVVRYAGGILGVGVPIAKAIAKLNETRDVDLDIMGHWHSYQSTRNYVVNGSLIGLSEYGLGSKCGFEPPSQTICVIHKKWGKTIEIPVYVE